MPAFVQADQCPAVPRRKASLSFGASPGKADTPLELRHWSPRHGSPHVSNTHSLDFAHSRLPLLPVSHFHTHSCSTVSSNQRLPHRKQRHIPPPYPRPSCKAFYLVVGLTLLSYFSPVLHPNGCFLDCYSV